MANDKYDIVIIGAGLGGLVCGCYLARAGKKVLIIEKNKTVGGCCTTFNRSGYEFDACVHSLGSCREQGFVETVLRDLELKKVVQFLNYEPCDIVVTPNYQIPFERGPEKLIKNISKVYRSEGVNIKRFIKVIYGSASTNLFIKLRKITFKEFLDSFIEDANLKAVLGVPVFGYAGLPPFKISAFTAIMLLKEFIIDGGYYPKGGMLEFSNAICNKAIELGCNVLTSTSVKKISFNNNVVNGVILDSNIFIPCSKVVANCSMFDVFKKMIPKKKVFEKSFSKILNLQPSLSLFSVYLGIKDNFFVPDGKIGNIWYLPCYDLKKIYYMLLRGLVDQKEVFMAIFSSSFLREIKKRTICLTVNAPYINYEFWKKHAKQFSQSLINKSEEIMPGLPINFEEMIISTPYSIYKFTNNYNGAAYGWRSDIKQSWNAEIIKLMHTINNLYFVGHWTCQMFGVPGVMNLGKACAIKILKGINSSEKLSVNGRYK